MALFRMARARRWDAYVARLKSEPGIVVTEPESSRGNISSTDCATLGGQARKFLSGNES